MENDDSECGRTLDILWWLRRTTGSIVVAIAYRLC